jgi:Zn-dependent protease with chaperone function
VLAIIAVIYIVVHIGTQQPGWVNPVLLVEVAVGVSLVVAIGSATRTASLRRGGPAVAELLGGRRIAPDTSDLEERRLLNVIEEMAIASGTPVPAVYLLDREEGINAFAAGYSIHDAAVAVTRGALQTLSRDELQGVIGHEFSHLLNGDMRLNVRLIGILHGILLLAIIGRGIVRFIPGGGRRRGGGDKDRGGFIIILGLTLLLVGYIGVFFGKLIKAAVSRQREFLADSAAVQFTRNPDGLAGALKKIRAQAEGSRIHNHHAEELSHLFFANGLGTSLLSALSTHPPLDERIRRLDPGWDGSLPQIETAQVEGPPRQAWGAPMEAVDGLVAAAAGPIRVTRPESIVASIGAPAPRHLAYASSWLGSLPPELDRAAHEASGATALVFAIVLAETESEGDRAAWEIVQAYGTPELEARIRSLVPLVRGQPADTRLPLLDLALPALQTLSPTEGERFRDAVEKVIRCDGRLLLFEFALLHVLARRLEGPDIQDRGTAAKRSFDELHSDARTLLSAIAWSGSDWEADKANAAFKAGARTLPSLRATLELEGQEAVSIERIDQSLTSFQHATPAVQRRLLEACAETAAYDGTLERVEMELLRAISEALNCPMPPFAA